MKRNTVIAVAAALMLALASFSYAKYVSGYKVVDVAEKKVTIQQGDDAPIMVPVQKGRYTVGDEVMYDAEKNKLKKSLRAAKRLHASAGQRCRVRNMRAAPDTLFCWSSFQCPSGFRRHGSWKPA